jgi:hypothetical protein
MRIAKFGTIGILSACATLTAATAAFAQAAPAPAPAAPATPDPAAAPAAPAPAAPAPAAQAQVGVGLPAAAPAADPNGSDHDSVVGHLAVGYLGRQGMLMATPGGTAQQQAPIIGIRYWIDPLIGIDAGIGLSISSSSTTPPAPAAEQKNFAPTVFMIHGGVPLALTSSKHFSFQIIPELNFGTASGSFQQAPNAAGMPTGPKTSFSGTHFDIGARAGAEIHFGFMGIPQLSLQAGVGLAFATDSTKATTDAFTDPVTMAVTPGATTKTSASSLATSVGDNPWNIFTTNVAALYYF